MAASRRFNVVDSSGWLAWFAGEPSARFFAPAMEDADSLVVPSICIAEVFRVFARRRGEPDALQAVAAMRQARIVALDTDLAIAAAVTGAAHKLPLADSIVYATSELVGGVVWTQDDDFEGLPNVRYLRKRSA